MHLSETIERVRTDFLRELSVVSSSKDLENLKTKFLGKRGPVQALVLELRNCAVDERPRLGKLVNDLKEELECHCQGSLVRLKEGELQERLGRERLDAAFPGRRFYVGRLHPITQTLNRALTVLSKMGFSVRLGPNLDSDYYNFEGLNFESDHPARDMQDSFYVSSEWLLRTHTSTVQVHAMEECTPPIRVVAPGRCFRNETVSARSHVLFHQIEVFYIDRKVTFADLFALSKQFWSEFLGERVEMRFRPSYFPFVEPGLEVDVRCTGCRGKGCRLCKHSGWLEVCGAGMIHPNVLKKGKIDPEEFSGYAWGMGVERPAILMHEIPDIRLFTQNDIRFLSQFP